MKIETIEQKIALRANVNAQKKIADFKSAIGKALNDLIGNTSYGGDNFGEYFFAEEGPYAENQDYGLIRAKIKVLRLAIKSHEEDNGRRRNEHPWPQSIWERETQSIRDELMSKMDLMQKLIMATPANDGGAVSDATTH